MNKTVWYADTLSKKHSDVQQALQTILARHGIVYRAIPNTKDIWCRDYMPVRAADGRLVQFVYYPQYLRETGDEKFITPPSCYRALEFAAAVQESTLVLDGGGVEICGSTGIVTRRIYKDNPWYDRRDLENKLRETLALEKLIVLDEEPGDATGHVDGMVRFLDERSVVLNDYAGTNDPVLCAFGKKVSKALKAHSLEVIPFPFAPPPYKKTVKKKVLPATGYYANFLRVGKVVILPLFGIHEDEAARNACEKIFSEYVVEVVGCGTLAKKGGVINCVSWEEVTKHKQAVILEAK